MLFHNATVGMIIYLLKHAVKTSVVNFCSTVVPRRTTWTEWPVLCLLVHCSVQECDGSELPTNVSWVFKLASELDLNNRTFYFSAPTQTDMGVRLTHLHIYLKILLLDLVLVSQPGYAGELIFSWCYFLFLNVAHVIRQLTGRLIATRIITVDENVATAKNLVNELRSREVAIATNFVARDGDKLA